MSDSENFESPVCECGKQFNHQSSLSRHRSTCKYVKQQEQMDMMMKMMMMNMNMNMMKPQTPDKKKKEKPKFSIKEYLKKCKDVPYWKTFIRNKKFSIEEYDTMYNNGAIEGTKKVINEWLSNTDKKKLPFVITNSQKTRFTIYCKEETEWKKYEGNVGYDKILNFIESLSCRMLFSENSNVIFERYPLAALSVNNSYRSEVREQQQIKIMILGTIANVADHTREIAKDILNNFIVDDQNNDDDNESVSDLSSDGSEY